MNVIIKQHKEEIKSLEGQARYASKALESNLEAWERKEYEAVRTEALNKAEAMRHHLARLAQMMAEERGEILSYEDALNQ